MSLSPWDLGADISFDFSLYRPRRASYVYATRASRGQRNESYRHATKHLSTTGTSVSSSGGAAAASGGPTDDDGNERRASDDNDPTSVASGGGRLGRKKRAQSYRAAVKHQRAGSAAVAAGGISTRIPEVRIVDDQSTLVPPASAVYGRRPDIIGDQVRDDDQDDDEAEGDDADEDNDVPTRHSSTASSNAIATPDDDDDATSTPVVTGRRCTKNLVALSIGFVLIFSAFRALQNVATALHGPRIGSTALACVHGSALVTGLLAPAVVGRVGPRWAVAIGAVGYPVWIAANLCVAGKDVCWTTTISGDAGGSRWATTVVGVVVLVAASLFVGVGQSVAWSAQVSRQC